VAGLTVAALVWWSAPAWADDVRVDANIATGLDVSTSITSDETAIQLQGLAIAMQSPEILAAVQNGRHRRIGFTVYLWADGDCPMVVDWRIIASAEDAVAMAADLGANAEAARQAKTGSLTGLSRGMNCGLTLLQSSPFVTDRDVLNIVSDGIENVRSERDVRVAREMLMAAGVGVNAMLLPNGQDGVEKVRPYYQANVVAGPMAFVLVVDKADALRDAWRRKFIGELAMAMP
jgi:Ca-activated chloride channel homolog